MRHERASTKDRNTVELRCYAFSGTAHGKRNVQENKVQEMENKSIKYKFVYVTSYLDLLYKALDKLSIFASRMLLSRVSCAYKPYVIAIMLNTAFTCMLNNSG